MESEENKLALLRRKLYKQGISSVSSFAKPDVAGAKFMVIEDDSYSAMGANYGPPDPPPTMETHHTLRCTMLMDESEVIQWVKDHEGKNSFSKRAYKIFKVDAVNINTSISVSVG